MAGMKTTSFQLPPPFRPKLTRRARRGLEMLRELRCALLLGTVPTPPARQIEFEF
jgi:hypothetical protein